MASICSTGMWRPREMSGESVAGIEATLLVEGFELGELVAVGGDKGLLVGGDVLLERDWFVLGGKLETAQCCLNLFGREMQALRDESYVGVEIFDLLAEEVAGDRWIVVDEEATFSVEEAATGSVDGNLADAVGFGEDLVAVGADDLEAPESGEEDGEDERDEILGGGELGGRELLGAAVGSFGEAVGVGVEFHADY